MPRRSKRPQREPTIALINIVFLMLVFFMVAGTLSQPLDRDLTLVNTDELEGRPPPNALVIGADGEMRFQGQIQTDSASYVSQLTEDELQKVRIVPDRSLPARELVSIGRALRAAGAGKVVMVTERAF